MEKGNIWSAKEKKKGIRKGRKIFCLRRKRGTNEGKYSEKETVMTYKWKNKENFLL